MAYTQSDLDNISAAVLALAQGDRAVRVKFSSGKEIEYGRASLSDLKGLRADIQAEVDAAAGDTDDYSYIQTSKGF